MVRLEPDDEFNVGQRLRAWRRRRPKAGRYLGQRLKRGCCLFFLFLFFGLLIIVLAVLSRIGLIDIPGFSQFFYQLSTPTRLIDVTATAKIEPRPQIDSGNQSVRLDITEEQLHVFPRQFLASQPDRYFAETIQAVITPRAIEIFGLLLKPVKTNVALDIVPTVNQGKLELTITKAQAGELDLPVTWLAGFLGGLLDQASASLNQNVSSLGQIKSVSLAEGKIIVEGQLNQI